MKAFVCKGTKMGRDEQERAQYKKDRLRLTRWAVFNLNKSQCKSSLRLRFVALARLGFRHRLKRVDDCDGAKI